MKTDDETRCASEGEITALQLPVGTTASDVIALCELAVHVHEARSSRGRFALLCVTALASTWAWLELKLAVR